ncbi:molybdate ABC transporter permease subunit [Mucilaginibacter sp. RS28]|uniref:Molybdenum transport system permease n=1 Tax=Mucilaginibacter straminoryzae TaxID=2932774 RepID=A0A9X1X4Q9_9SPHI|nr:molybdate ABC transporter permease subunit [Mucilaginibacter straminoryzae]MCJ8210055.1 molybdate ABC transporter permease subunit [Mucilaginibacter straminoryzae]
MGIDLQPLWLTFKLAFITTLCLLVLGIPVAALLAKSKSRLKPFAEALIGLPLVLPPSVLGFYLLLILSPTGWLGSFLQQYFNLRLVFTFPGLVVGSVIYSLPFMIHPIQGGLQNLPKSLKEASWTMGHSKLVTFFKVQLPNIQSALLTGIVLTFAHTLGEFGLVLMIGGSIPKVTKVASIAIYNETEALNFSAAHTYSGILLVISFTILLLVYLMNRRVGRGRLAI